MAFLGLEMTECLTCGGIWRCQRVGNKYLIRQEHQVLLLTFQLNGTFPVNYSEQDSKAQALEEICGKPLSIQLPTPPINRSLKHSLRLDPGRKMDWDFLRLPPWDLVSTMVLIFVFFGDCLCAVKAYRKITPGIDFLYAESEADHYVSKVNEKRDVIKGSEQSGPE